MLSPRAVQESMLTSGLFYKDAASKYESVELANGSDNINPGYQTRFNICKDSKLIVSLTDSESDSEQLFSPPPPKEKYSNEKRKARVEKKEEHSKKPRTDYNFSDPTEERKIIPPISAYLGKGVTISIKEYRKSFYLSLQKTVGEDIKNRFNMNLEQLGALKKAINVFYEHIKKN
ncbi:uncharacterized protein TNCT_304271 [Trichonephila clavata]|uniref:Uncharacterized protein n=1 Tax=Trichonephila clavata TaxID=2740835 RepID=A0A8X6G0B2_TRICU|nr:uncharacterized protein TNCT_304271 [Trichonephila clavata]